MLFVKSVTPPMFNFNSARSVAAENNQTSNLPLLRLLTHNNPSNTQTCHRKNKKLSLKNPKSNTFNITKPNISYLPPKLKHHPLILKFRDILLQ